MNNLIYHKSCSICREVEATILYWSISWPYLVSGISGSLLRLGLGEDPAGMKAATWQLSEMELRKDFFRSFIQHEKVHDIQLQRNLITALWKSPCFNRCCNFRNRGTVQCSGGLQMGMMLPITCQRDDFVWMHPAYLGENGFIRLPTS